MNIVKGFKALADSNSSRADTALSEKATLGMLNAIQSGETFTQRSLASRLGVALGLTNSLLKRCVRKGLVKAKVVPASRYVYFLTPKGFAEKSRLVSEYLATSLSFFREAREQYHDVFVEIKHRGLGKVAVYGTGELAEIAILSSQIAEAQPACVLAPGSNLPHFCGVSVLTDLDGARDLDAVVIAVSDAPQEAYDMLIKALPGVKILAVPLLHVAANGSTGFDLDDGRVGV